MSASAGGGEEAPSCDREGGMRSMLWHHVMMLSKPLERLINWGNYEIIGSHRVGLIHTHIFYL